MALLHAPPIFIIWRMENNCSCAERETFWLYAYILQYYCICLSSIWFKYVLVSKTVDQNAVLHSQDLLKTNLWARGQKVKIHLILNGSNFLAVFRSETQLHCNSWNYTQKYLIFWPLASNFKCPRIYRWLQCLFILAAAVWVCYLKRIWSAAGNPIGPIFSLVPDINVARKCWPLPYY